MLRRGEPDEFAETYSLYHERYFPLIYPHTKEQVLCVVKAKNNQGKSRLYYFLYLPAQKQLFEWIKPVPRPAGGHYSFYIQEDIKNLSSWGDEFDLHEPSVTMDDFSFWKEHVFKKENDSFLYLKELNLPNHQRDLYPLF